MHDAAECYATLTRTRNRRGKCTPHGSLLVLEPDVPFDGTNLADVGEIFPKQQGDLGEGWYDKEPVLASGLVNAAVITC